MDFLKDVVQVAERAIDKGVAKTVQLKEVMLLKSRLDTCEEVLNKSYMELGKKYYELFGGQPDEAFEKYCRDIKNAQRGKEEIGQELAKAKERLKSK